MNKKQGMLFFLILLVCLFVVSFCCCTPDERKDNVASSDELNALISKADKKEVSSIIEKDYFATYCNERTISILYENFKSKSIMISALAKASDKTLQDERVIPLSYNEETKLDRINHYFTAKELIDNFDKGMVVPKSLDKYIKSKLKNPSTLQYSSVYFYRSLAYDDVNEDIGFMAEVLFSAGNSLGGTIDTKWFVTFDKEMQVDHHSEQSWLNFSNYLDGNIWEE